MDPAQLEQDKEMVLFIIGGCIIALLATAIAKSMGIIDYSYSDCVKECRETYLVDVVPEMHAACLKRCSR